MDQQWVAQGFLANDSVEPPLVVRFEFNPAPISDSKTVYYADRHSGVGGNAPGKEYEGGGPRTISFSLQLHGLERGTDTQNPKPQNNGVSTELAKLRSFMYPTVDDWSAGGQSAGSSGRRLIAPPTCIFGYGDKRLECVVTELTISETQFNSALAPVRAEVTVTLVVIEDKTNAPYQADVRRRKHLAASPAVRRDHLWG